ncbi:all trans-polyprenyl-diphosphate synthase PDSS2-like [Onthophagus taurus]|uniref:all trans-polyprenyl-diphosphate synthase PDSS2-like n=1 Tax=Onthophagus taurus TaxID=166361 RepID=UPI000C20F576|nr:decaprenyl-diphosphate synthase subunit 2-like [Onthophagus taurus]XP_022918780.1 decaprenyl-diphosphate synthase subunit 2-like [Onthophagus taurus]XP_022918781.1 decaprenyl-diphosphate synthase subunit 2-like [Onthophagus taurus]
MNSLRKSIHTSFNYSKRCANLSTLSSINEKLKVDHNNWNKSVAEAEKVIGYPTSFLNLRWLLSDEVANVALHLRKLLGTNHPLLSIAKDLLMNTENPSWGLIVLLVAKAGGQHEKFRAIDKDVTAGILHNQRILAEVTEMIRTSNLLHKGIINVTINTEHAEDMNFGNKIALLCGDYLLSKSYHELASMKNHSLNELMSSALRDLAEEEFLGPKDKQNRSLPARPNKTLKPIEIQESFGTDPIPFENVMGNAKSEWTLHALLSGGTLLGKSCQGVLKLGQHEHKFVENGYLFGRNLALALQAGREYENTYNNQKISLVSAPILFHLQYDPKFYNEIEEMVYEENELNYGYICTKIKKSSALEDTRQLQKEFSQKALKALERFSENKSKEALREIILSLEV